MNLFLVEDSNFLRERLTRMISRLGGIQIVGSASTASEAIARISQTRPDVVLLDIRLAQGTGLDVLQHLKQQPAAPVVIVLTNFAYPQYRKKYLRAGADFFFDKSTEFELTLQALQQLRYRFTQSSATTRQYSFIA
jgi:two-component system response regulator DevR